MVYSAEITLVAAGDLIDYTENELFFNTGIDLTDKSDDCKISN
jgi:hypothetical protein